MGTLPSQWKFLTAKTKYTAYVGGIGSGKTWGGALKALATSPMGDGLVVAPTYQMLRDVTQRAVLDILEQAGLRFDLARSEGILYYNGHRLYFRSADNPERLRGLNVTFAWVDEGALCRELVWRIILGRLRVGKTSAFVTTTPAGFNWVWQYFKDRRDVKYGMVQASTRENRYLPEDYVEDLEANYTGEFARQELDGEFVGFEGLVYNEFRDPIHVIPPFTIPEDWQVFAAIDFGYTNPFVFLWGAVDPDGRLYICGEHYQRRWLMRQHADVINARNEDRKWRVRWIAADHDAQDIAELRDLGFNLFPAKKEIKRGIKAVKARLKVQGDGKPRMFIFEDCVYTRREMGMYRWPEGKTGSQDETAKEDPVDEANHAMDALRYMVAQLDFAAVGGRIRSLAR